MREREDFPVFDQCVSALIEDLLFHHLGINVDRTTIADNNGRPQYLVEDGGKVLPELV